MDPLQNQQPNPNPQPIPPIPPVTANPAPAHSQAPVGPIVGSVIIIVVLILGALYFWGQRANTPVPVIDNNETVQEASLPSASDDVSAIETDLQTESFVDLETAISEIE